VYVDDIKHYIGTYGSVNRADRQILTATQMEASVFFVESALAYYRSIGWGSGMTRANAVEKWIWNTYYGSPSKWFGGKNVQQWQRQFSNQFCGGIPYAMSVIDGWSGLAFKGINVSIRKSIDKSIRSGGGPKWNDYLCTSEGICNNLGGAWYSIYANGSPHPNGRGWPELRAAMTATGGLVGVF
jgi:hypothetical protein